jgi:hypothetical protein
VESAHNRFPKSPRFPSKFGTIAFETRLARQRLVADLLGLLAGQGFAFQRGTPLKSKLESHHMNKQLGALTAVLTLFAVTGCGKREAAGESPAGPTINQSETPVDAPSNETLVGNDVAPTGGQENAAPEISTNDEPEATNPETPFDAKNSSFSLEGKTVVLKNGLSSVPAAPGSASSITTRYLGKMVHGDLTRDGKEDVAYFVTRDGPGSGRFYYVVAAINGKNGYKTTNAFLVGDRINPQSLHINSNELQANFVGRGKGEPMSTPPSRQSVLLLKVTPGGVLEGLMK